MLFDTNEIKLSSVYGGIPKNISFFENEINTYNQDKNNSLKLMKTMGYKQHRLSINSTTFSEVAIDLFEQFLNKEKIGIDDVDAIITVSQIPDHFLPNMSSIIHGKLGLSKDTLCIDINDGCTGFIRGLMLVSSLMKNKNISNVVLLCGDMLSGKVSKKDRNSYPLIGDAVTLNFFQKRKSTSNKLPYGEIYHNGKSAKSLIIHAGGLKEPFTESSSKMIKDEDGNERSRENLFMKGRDVFAFTQSTVASFLKEYYELAKKEDVKMIFSHQANEFIITRLRAKLGVDSEKFPSTVINKYGNSSSATIPMQIADSCINHSKEINGKNVLVTGFGVGLSWAAACLYISKKCTFNIFEGDY